MFSVEKLIKHLFSKREKEMRKIYLAAFVLGVILGSLIEVHWQTFDELQSAREITAIFSLSNADSL